MKCKFLKITLIACMFIITDCLANQPDYTLNEKLLNAMKEYHVPVVGYAIIKNHKIISAETLAIEPDLKVSKKSIFQAASISKSVSSYGVLHLVSKNKLSLDASVNDQLTTWKIPLNEFNKTNPVTVRQLLDMTSGLSVSGFPGHVQGKPLPTLQQVLNGESPSNTAPIRVFYTPGSKYFYSGGAFQVMEQLVEDITRQPFSSWMENKILKPLNMNQSIFKYPLDKKWREIAVPGFLSNGTKVEGGWNNYAIAGAGGLWSTPTDLAKFAINVSNAYLGKDNRIVEKQIAKQMLVRQKNTDYGLGFVINGDGNTLNFRKAGHNLGYHSQLIMFPNSGDGIVIMTNSEKGEYVIHYLIGLIAQKYHWPCYFPFFDELITIPEEACNG